MKNHLILNGVDFSITYRPCPHGKDFATEGSHGRLSHCFNKQARLLIRSLNWFFAGKKQTKLFGGAIAESSNVLRSREEKNEKHESQVLSPAAAIF